MGRRTPRRDRMRGPGPLTALALALIGFLLWTVWRGVRGERQRCLVVRAIDAGWEIRRAGALYAEEVFPVKREAVERARELARAQAPCQLVIHRLDGSVEHRHDYSLGDSPVTE